MLVFLFGIKLPKSSNGIMFNLLTSYSFCCKVKKCRNPQICKCYWFMSLMNKVWSTASKPLASTSCFAYLLHKALLVEPKQMFSIQKFLCWIIKQVNYHAKSIAEIFIQLVNVAPCCPHSLSFMWPFCSRRAYCPLIYFKHVSFILPVNVTDLTFLSAGKANLVCFSTYFG